jgi:hypothetical protein
VRALAFNAIAKKSSPRTTPQKEKVESRLEQRSRAPTVGALGDAGAIAETRRARNFIFFLRALRALRALRVFVVLFMQIVVKLGKILSIFGLVIFK